MSRRTVGGVAVPAQPRDDLDRYYTPRRVCTAVMKHVWRQCPPVSERGAPLVLCDPCAGAGAWLDGAELALAELHLESRGHWTFATKPTCFAFDIDPNAPAIAHAPEALRRDFLVDGLPDDVKPDWLLTNFPFNQLNGFVDRAAAETGRHVVHLARFQAAATLERWTRYVLPRRARDPVVPHWPLREVIVLPVRPAFEGPVRAGQRASGRDLHDVAAFWLDRKWAAAPTLSWLDPASYREPRKSRRRVDTAATQA